MTYEKALNEIQEVIKKNLEPFIGQKMNEDTSVLIRMSVLNCLQSLDPGIDMNQVKLKVETDKNTGTVHIAPENEYTKALLKNLAIFSKKS